MLTRLVIHDVVLIEKLTLPFAAGLNVFTGETGAGKSIVLDSLGLALGARSDAGLIRNGAEQASVIAEFDLPDDHDVIASLNEQGLDHTSPLILRRVISRDGKSRAFINDQPISIGLLKSIGEQLLEIHGQFETHGLLNPATHRGLLDSFANLGKLRLKVSTLYKVWKDAANKQLLALAERDQARAEEDFLRSAFIELDDISPEPAEATLLSEQRTQLQHHEKIMEALQTAEHLLSGEHGVNSNLAQAGKAVARIANKAVGLQDLLASIDRTTQEAHESNHQLQNFMQNMNADPQKLQRIEERLFALRSIARKHNVQADELHTLRCNLSAKLALINDRGDLVNALTKAAIEARHLYKENAEELSAKRRQAAAQLQTAIMHELPPLKFEQAQFIIDVTTLDDNEWSADGMDLVSFLASTNAGTPAGSLQKIASGGELSRFMLALKVVLAASSPISTLVFDEIDAGIGGATASAVGERLARLAEFVQILVVTHSPQVAARGTTHLRVHKHTKSKQTFTDAETLSSEARCEEIARMLAGTQVTDAARQAALSLLNDITPKKKHIRKATRS